MIFTFLTTLLMLAETRSVPLKSGVSHAVCKILCQHRQGCTAPMFDEILFACQLVFNTSGSKNGCTPLNNLDVNQGFTIHSESLIPICSSRHLKTFHAACRHGDLVVVKEHLSKGLVDVNCRGRRGRTALMEAARTRKEKIIDLLLEQNCDLSAVDYENNNVFHYACISGKVSIVKKLLGDQIDIECKGRKGRTSLMQAVLKGFIRIVKLLVDRGADVQTEDNQRYNILHAACEGGNMSMVLLVLSYDIFEIDCRGRDGRTPLMQAALKGHNLVVKFLLHKGADIKTLDNNEYTSLHVACEGGHVNTVRYLVSLRVFDINCKGRKGRTPLMQAVLFGHKQVVEFIDQRHRASLTALDDAGFSVLHLACLQGQLDMVKYLVSFNKLKGFERRQDKKGRTPIDLAARKGYSHIVKILK